MNQPAVVIHIQSEASAHTRSSSIEDAEDAGSVRLIQDGSALVICVSVAYLQFEI
jgi:hypothetical protein